ncbi:MAG: DNA polymerase IV [Anaerolineae bacterium]|nr:MAG: DNA polymerase IV [Anaerolineae bacterium]
MRQILHVDLDAFFCSVEEIRNPDLRGKAFVVGGSPKGRGVVASASYPARQFGIKSAMPMSRALRLHPDLIIVSSKHGDYSEHSRRVMAFLREAVPVMQQMSIDEAFLDVSDDPRGGEQAASEMQSAIHDRFKLPTSWGIATNKLVAKIATEVGKPKGVVVVPPGKEATFLAPLPVSMMWGVGPKSSRRFAEFGIRTIGDLAALPEARLTQLFGARGTDLAARAKGLDDRPVQELHDRRSVSAERTFPQDVDSVQDLRRHLLHLSERVGTRVRRAGVVGSTVRIKLRWPDFSTFTRQMRLSQPTDQDGEIYAAALKLFTDKWRPGKAVRLLGVGVADLGPPMRQLELFDRGWEQDYRLLRAVDDIREKYGHRALRRAGSMSQPPPEDSQ